MKIVVAINDVYFRNKVLYRVILKNQEHDFFVISVKNKSSQNLGKKVKFWGVKGVFFLGISTFINQLQEKILPPTYEAKTSCLKSICNEFSIRMISSFNINEDYVIDEVEKYKPDLFISYQNQICKDEILSLPKRLAINCHNSLLPNFRGRKPEFWAMLEDANYIGNTVHTMHSKIDTGRIVAQTLIPLNNKNSYFENSVQVNEVADETICNAIKEVAMEDFCIESYEIIRHTKAYKEPTKQEINEFKKKNNIII